MADHDGGTPGIAAEIILDATAVGLLVVDRDGRNIYVNEATAEIAGVPRDVLMGQLFDSSAWHARDRTGKLLARDEYPIGRALQGESVTGGELIVDSPERGTIVMLASARPVFDEDGEVDAVIATIQDVTEAVDWETQLETSQARLRAVFEHASDAIALIDDDGAYLAVNPAAAAMLGYTQDELLARTVEDVLAPPADPDQILGEFLEVGADRREIELLRADGTRVTVEAVAVANVEPGVHLSIWRDLSETRRMLQQVERIQQRLATVVTGSQIGLLLVEPSGRIVLANPAARSILRAPDAEDRLLADVLTAQLPELPDALATTGRARREELMLQTLDGRWLTFHVDTVEDTGERLVHVEDATASVAAEQTLRDALRREQEAREELLEVGRMKDTFMSAVSHELRTPLTTIRGAAETVKRHGDRLSQEQRTTFLDKLLQHSDRLESLLSDLLSLDRLRRGAGILDVGPTDLRALLDSIVANVATDQHAITVDAPERVVTVDRAKVERMVENLVANAVRHTARGTRVEVRGACVDGRVVIEVEDDGAGIPDDLRASVFDMFAKGSTGRARAEGTGVGLALVREFAALMGGTAELGRGELGGTLMRVTIPDATSGAADG